jgi:serine/threonine protein kinase
MARKELDIGGIIKNNVEYWRDYYCFTEFICGAPDEKHIRVGMDDYQDTYGIAPYCGVTLNSILTGKYPITAIECCCLMEALKQLAIGLSELHRIQIYHQDIHDENVLFNPEDSKLRWIDFGLAEDHFDIKKRAINSGKNWDINPVIASARIEDTASLIFSIIKPTLEFIRYKIRNSKESDLTKKCDDDATYYLYLMPRTMNNYILPNKNKSYNSYFYSKLVIEQKYNKFLNEFVDDLDETKKCKWMFKNKNNKNKN